MKLLQLSIFALVVSLVSSFAQEQNAGRVHGYVFGDYFYKLGGNNQQVTGSQYSKTQKDFQAFEFRRLYLYYDHDLSESFSTQFLLEGNDKTFEKGGKHTVFIKTAYLQWKNIFGKSDLAFGLVPTPTWSWAGSEKTWKYRSVEKTIMDYRGLGIASDIGVAVRGKFDKEGTISYVAMIGNGTGQRPENDKFKKYYGALIVKPMKEILLDAYLDYEPAALGKDVTTLKGFVAYQVGDFTIGIEAIQQTQRKVGASNADVVPSGLSIFARAPIPGLDGFNAFARFDTYDPNTNASDKGYKEAFYLLGLHYTVSSNVHLMPNIWINSFSPKDASLPSKDADVVARCTFFFLF